MDYKKIYDSQVFELSRCIYKENTFVDTLRVMLSSLGYQAQDTRQFVWQRDMRRVIIAMVDDIEHVNYEFQDNFLDTLTANDIVITDSWFNRPINAKVISVPDSWFGIYAHSPSVFASKPTKLFSLAVNRIDYNRMMVFLETYYRGYVNTQSLVNFNCARHTDKVDTQDQRDLWKQNWQNIDQYYKDQYSNAYAELSEDVPFTNHRLNIDQQHQYALVNVVLETYTGDNSVAISEKTFRALVTPRPWRVFGGAWTVKRLEALGFDCLSDIVDHDTDGLKMVEDKIMRFVKSSANTWNTLKWEDIADRCHAAAAHNQQLLSKFQKQWPTDYAHWLTIVAHRLDN